MGAGGGLAWRHDRRGGWARRERARGPPRPGRSPRDRRRRGRPASGGRPFEVTVTNVGGTSAENVIEITAGDVTREVNLDLVAKGDTESAAIVVPSDTAGPPHAEVVSYTNP
jgi:hypothetical protein